MYDALACGTIYVLTYVLFDANLLDITVLIAIRNVGLIINIIAFFGYMSSITCMLRSTNAVHATQYTVRKILFSMVIASIIMLSIYQTTYKIVECINDNCLNNNENSYKLLSIIMNVTLLTQCIIHMMFDTSACRITEIEPVPFDNSLNLEDNLMNKKIKIIFLLFIFALSYNVFVPLIVSDYKHMYTDQIIVCNGIMITCIIFMLRSLFVDRISTFRHLFIRVIGMVCFVIILVIVCRLMIHTDGSYFAIACINSLLSVCAITAIIVCCAMHCIARNNARADEQLNNIIDQYVELYDENKLNENNRYVESV
jgi:hypothetical protein